MDQINRQTHCCCCCLKLRARNLLLTKATVHNKLHCSRHVNSLAPLLLPPFLLHVWIAFHFTVTILYFPSKHICAHTACLLAFPHPKKYFSAHLWILILIFLIHMYFTFHYSHLLLNMACKKVHILLTMCSHTCGTDAPLLLRNSQREREKLSSEWEASRKQLHASCK